MGSYSEATIILTPQDHGLIRMITVNPAKSSIVQICRASKSIGKGFAPADDNANFESPIMSRTHAEIVVSEGPNKVIPKVIHIRDLKSTHGTFLKGERLKPNVNYVLKSGDTITFGTRVTSGTQTFSPKEVKVEFHWSNPTPPKSPSKKYSNSYSVPSDSEEDADDNYSLRAESVVAHDSNESVSTSADVVITSARHLDAPLQIDLTGADGDSSNSRTDQDNQIGSSQANPIDLVAPKSSLVEDIAEALDSSSDDEAPESLPMNPYPTTTVPRTFVNDTFRYHSTMDVSSASVDAVQTSTQTSTQNAAEPTDGPQIIDWNSEAVTDYSDNESVSDGDCPTSSVHAPDWTDEYSEGEDIDEDDLDDGHPSEVEFNEEEDQDTSNMATSKITLSSGKIKPYALTIPNATESARPPYVLVEDSQAQAQAQAQVQVANNYRTGNGVILDLALSYDSIFPKDPAPTQRAPSPSDAALVKPAVKAPSLPYDHRRDNYALPQPDVSMFGWRDGIGSMPSSYLDNTGTFVPPVATTPYRAPNAQSQGYRGYEFDNYLDSNDRALPRYEDGPFTTSNDKSESQPTGAADELSDSNCNPTPFSQPIWRGAITDFSMDIRSPRIPLMGSHSPGAAVTCPQEQVQAKSSRVPIAHIVNSNQDIMTPRATKRKADEMLSSESDSPAMATQTSGPSPLSQDSILPDAQPRENMVELDELSQDTSVSGASSREVVPQDREGPARKKAKWSSTTSRPIKAFVSGVLVGCLSLAGACAAFIATIPDSVKDEARREFL